MFILGGSQIFLNESERIMFCEGTERKVVGPGVVLTRGHHFDVMVTSGRKNLQQRTLVFYVVVHNKGGLRG